ncbi:MAG: PhzF family phenazine biosynthesis protein [Firmicutes bacterium]|nr:PhzF family phenazine biosynthesis protein [Bacillota bacterium]
MKFYIADAFTSVEFSGHTSAVVIPKRKNFLPTEVMMKTADELRYSVSVFAIPSQERPPKGYDGIWEARYFSVNEEREFCSFATVALFQSLMDAGLAWPGKTYQLRTTERKIPVTIESGIIMMDIDDPTLEEVIGEDEKIAKIYQALGLNYYQEKQIFEILGQGALTPEVICSGSSKNITIPVATTEELNGIKPDYDKVAELCTKYDAFGFHVFALDMNKEKSGDKAVTYIHVRNFSPLHGDYEEAAAGVANCELAFYLTEHKLIRKPDYRDKKDKTYITCIQGEVIGRTSKVYVEVTSMGEEYIDGDPNIKVRIGGRGVVLVDGNIDISNYL